MQIMPWEFAGSALALAGETAAAVGGFKQTMFEAKINRENAKLKGLARKEMGYRALSNLRTQRMTYQQDVGNAAVGIAASGVDVGDSTSMEIRQNMEDIADRNRSDAIREHSFEAKKSVTEERHMFQQSDQMEKNAKITLASNLMIAAGNAALGIGGSIKT